MRGVRRDAGGGSGPNGVHLPVLRHAAVAPAGAHAAAAAAPEGAAPSPRSRRCPGRAASVRLLRRAPERAGRSGALRLPSLRCRARRRHREAPALPPVVRYDGGRHTRGASRRLLDAADPPSSGGMLLSWCYCRLRLSSIASILGLCLRKMELYLGLEFLLPKRLLVPKLRE